MEEQRTREIWWSRRSASTGDRGERSEEGGRRLGFVGMGEGDGHDGCFFGVAEGGRRGREGMGQLLVLRENGEWMKSLGFR
ncbi:hypothetical protein HAX54_041333, partial [Datura stramonium]|nr:hypothetical protein [Datura stramonium]